jgi:hypothetical protein
MVSMVEMRQATNEVSMKKDDDPSSLFEQICGMDNRFQRSAIHMTDEEKIATIIMAAPKEYVTLLTSKQRQKGANLKLEDLQEAMLAQWRQTINSVEHESEGTYIGLAAFSGIYYNCQRTGHRTNDRPEKRTNNGKGRGGGGRGRGRGRGRKTCCNCGKVGHLEATCWDPNSRQMRT